MSDLATADRKTVAGRLASGMPLEEAAAEFVNDAYFDAWYQNTKSSLEELVK